MVCLVGIVLGGGGFRGGPTWLIISICFPVSVALPLVHIGLASGSIIIFFRRSNLMRFHSISADSPTPLDSATLPKSTTEVYHLANGSFREVSPAKIFPSLVKDLGWLVSDRDFGTLTATPLATYDLDSQSWKTSEPSLFEDLTLSLGRLPSSGMMRNGKIFALPMSERPTDGNESGLWPTPVKTNGFARFSPQSMERKEAGLTRPSGAKIGTDLKWDRRTIPFLYRNRPSPILTEWLIGLPIGWTDSQRQKIQLSLRLPN